MIYVARFADAVFALHAFQNKNQRASQRDIAIAKARLREMMRDRRCLDRSVLRKRADALADAPEQAANLCARAELKQQIGAIVKKNRATQTDASANVA